VGENATNVFALNVCQLRKDAYPDLYCSDRYHFDLGISSKIIRPQEFTQRFALSISDT